MSAPGGLRISAGARRGLKLQVPRAVRPTPGRLREALFDIWGARLAAASFLDLFAGSGAVGIEAASRGAGRVMLVEGDRAVLTVLRRNLRLAELPAVSELEARLPEQLARRLPRDERFDLVFADPPYRFDGFAALLAAVVPYLAAAGEIALEHGWREGQPEAPAGLTLVRSRRYGDSGLTLFRRLDGRKAPIVHSVTVGG